MKNKQNDDNFLTISINKKDVDNSDEFLSILIDLLSAKYRMEKYIELINNEKIGNFKGFAS